MILDRFRLTGRAAIVTGAGRGIGAATALALAEAGADVLISARTQGQLDEVAKRIAATGRRAEVVVADLSDLDAVAGLAGAAESAFGRLDIVVNNVGGAMPRPFLETSPSRMLQAFSFNVATAHALNRSAVPIMRATGEAHSNEPAIVNISSAMGRLSGRSIAAYGTAKAGLSHYTRDAAQDLAPQIRVNAIEVGAVATSALEIVVTDDAFRERTEQAIPVGRLGEPEDVAAAVVYLASPAASYITGKVIEVDGGIIQSPLSAARISSP